MNNMKSTIERTLIGIVLIGGLVFVASRIIHYKIPKGNRDLVLLREKNQLEKQGRDLEKLGEFDEAIMKYKEAVEFDVRIYGSDKGRPLASIAEVYQKKGNYGEALKILKRLREFHPKHEYYIDWEKELNALIESQTAQTYRPVYDYIKNYRQKHASEMPPMKYTFGSIRPISTVLHLYSTLGDHDAGIKFIDEILAYFRTGKAGDPKPGKTDAEYLKVREAFEQDKREGFKGCAGTKPGEVCIGRATQALIQSDYFPW